MPRSLGTGGGIEFRWLTISTGQGATVSIQNMECLFVDQANYVISAMMDEFEMETSDFRGVAENAQVTKQII